MFLQKIIRMISYGSCDTEVLRNNENEFKILKKKSYKADTKLLSSGVLNIKMGRHWLSHTHLVMCFWESAIAYSATTVLPAEV